MARRHKLMCYQKGAFQPQGRAKFTQLKYRRKRKNSKEGRLNVEREGLVKWHHRSQFVWMEKVTANIRIRITLGSSRTIKPKPSEAN